MLESLKKIKRSFVSALIVLMTVVIFLSIVELAYVIVVDIISPPVLLLDIRELLEIFGLIMLVVIGIELIESVMKTYLVEGVDHVRVVLSVALIAIARKVIILDLHEVSSLSLIGIGVIILALAFGYFFVGGLNGREK
ncbi:MAG: phosphate-starvation-inducible PsiE family protein [Candidatus Saccharicenans sp.]|uniref:phosphate-starvation-inducible PsiE family protein n=1 Tax=Candidatus Saccharicenans sp. TaxID=2819258 RepID=UPI00404ACDD9